MIFLQQSRLFECLSELIKPVFNVRVIQIVPLLDQQVLHVEPILAAIGDNFLDDQIFRRTNPRRPAAEICLNRPLDNVALIAGERQ